MATIFKRKVIKTGVRGLRITIPTAWANYHNLKGGDRVIIKANDDLIVKVVKEEKEEAKNE